MVPRNLSNKLPSSIVELWVTTFCKVQAVDKYGIRLPKSVKEAIEIDNENGNTLWWDALMQKMKNVRPAFEVFEGDEKSLVGYKKIKCHIVWDVKLGENFR